MKIQDKSKINEPPEGYEDCCFENFDKNGVYELKSWFTHYFDKQLNQSLWQSDFTPSYDNYFDKNYNNLEELKTQAEFVRQEIKRLEYTKTTD